MQLVRTELRLRWFVAAAMGAIVALAAVRLYCLRGLWTTHRIAGGSMAETLVGDHYRITCADCRFTFRCDAEHVPGDGRAVCPNCGYVRNNLTPPDFARGERVLVDCWPLLWRQPRRGEIVMAASSDESPEPIVKRVAALPGERLGIRRGDLTIDGQTVSKTLPELRQVALLVHDNAFQPRKSAGLPARWQGESAETQWRQAGPGFQFASHSNPKAERFDWLLYHHWPCVGGPALRTRLSPVLDNDSYNQATSRQLNTATDLLLNGRVSVATAGSFAFAINDGRERFAAICDTRDGSVVLLRGDREVQRKSVPELLRFQSSDFSFALCDRQILLSLNRRMLLRYPIETADSVDVKDTLHPLAIGARATRLEVTELQIWRDLYYLEPFGAGRSWQADATLPGSQIALLGDNAAISIDSRHWLTPGVPLGKIVGKVYKPFWQR